MGPLFSFALSAALGICVTAVCFIGAVFFLPVRRAAVLAIISTIGGGVGVVLAAVAAVPFVGIGQTLSSAGAVVVYLVALGCGGFLGAVAAAVCYLRLAPGRGKHAF
jgi:hypothetical protein